MLSILPCSLTHLLPWLCSTCTNRTLVGTFLLAGTSFRQHHLPCSNTPHLRTTILSFIVFVESVSSIVVWIVNKLSPFPFHLRKCRYPLGHILRLLSSILLFPRCFLLWCPSISSIARKSLLFLFVFFTPCSPHYMLPPISPTLQNLAYLFYCLSCSLRVWPLSLPPCRRFFFPFRIFGAPFTIDSHGFYFIFYCCPICAYPFT